MIVKEEKKIWRQAILREDATIAGAIKNLNKTCLQIILVVSKKGKFVGTVTDGDIRRGFIKGENISGPIKAIVNKKSHTVNEKNKITDIKKIMSLYDVRQVPILQKNKKIIGLFISRDHMLKSNENIPVIIMAGGKGTRLRPLTNSLPKPLLKVKGKPILENIIIKAKKEGFKNFYISINYLGHMIERYFLDGKKWDVKIKYIKEKTPLGTAGSLRLIRSCIKNNFIVLNADVLSNVSFSDILDFHIKNKASATMTVRSHKIQHPFGIVKTKGMKIANFEEKPIINSYVNAGVYVLTPSIFKFFKKQKTFDMPDLFIWLKEKNKKVIVFPIHENWIDLGIKESFKKIAKIKNIDY